MSDLYAVWDSVDGDFETGTKEEMGKVYEKRREQIEEFISDGSNGDETAYMMRVVRQLAVVKDEDNEEDPQKHGFDFWVRVEDINHDEDEFKYYHVIWHYQALIKAKSFEDMLRLYNQYICNASDEDLEQNFELVDRDRAIVMCARAKDDNTNELADTDELLKDFDSDEECVLLMDGVLA